MLSQAESFLRKVGGWAETYNGIYVLDEETGEIRYIERDKVGTEEEDSSWVVVEKADPRRKNPFAALPYSSSCPASSGSSVVYKYNPDEELDNLLKTLQEHGGVFETFRYIYCLETENQLILRKDKLKPFKNYTKRDGWEILGQYRVVKDER